MLKQGRDRGRQHRRGEDLAVAGSRHVAQSDHHQQIGGLHQSHHSCDHDRADQKAIHLASGGVEGAGHEGERDQGGDGEGDESRPVRKADYGVQSQGGERDGAGDHDRPAQPLQAGSFERPGRPTAGQVSEGSDAPENGPLDGQGRGARPTREGAHGQGGDGPTHGGRTYHDPARSEGHPAVRRHDEQDRQQGRESC